MTSAASDILSVAYLQKEAKIINKLRVVPLFETLDDLKNAKSIMNSLFSLPWYRKSINYKQEIMIGYSDSSKDAGKLSASWHQYKLQEEILKLAKKHKIDITFSNEQEIMSLIGVKKFNEVIEFGKQLKKILIITRGDKGSIAINEDGVTECGSKKDLKTSGSLG